MKEFASSVSTKGQITLPVEARPASSLDEMYQPVPASSPPRTWSEITEPAAEEHAQHVAKEGFPHR